MGQSDKYFATYYDGNVADPRRISFFITWQDPQGIDPRDERRYEEGTVWFLEIFDIELGREIAQWDLQFIYEISAPKGELRLACEQALPNARLVIRDPEMAMTVRKSLPLLAAHAKKARSRQTGVVGLATLAFASVIGAYIFGVPLLANQIVSLVSPETEIQLGETIVAQLENAFKEQGGLVVCDNDPTSIANVAISQFVQAALEGIDTPFPVDIQVVKNTIPNAFALPGGHAFYFSGLLKHTRSPDEFAGVMAHEIGHVVYRHGMQKLIATAGTGLLVGFILGDITGISIAGAMGSALINNSFSRDAERQADNFSFQVAAKMGFDTSGLPDLLDRISKEDGSKAASALLSTHPLNQERRAALARFGTNEGPTIPAFTHEEWQAISTMCVTGEAEMSVKNKVKQTGQ